MLDRLAPFMEERTVFVVMALLAHHITFWSWSLFIHLCYAMNWFEEYKIQTVPYNKELTYECFKKCLINHVLLYPVAIYFSFDLFKHFGMTVFGPIPGMHIIIRDFVCAVAVNDTLFYWAHRMLHHKSIYKYIHKQHHMFKVNVGFSAEYANPIEDVFANIIPTMIAVLLLGSHAVVVCAWLVIRVSETLDAHSNFDFPFSPFSYFSWQGGARRHEFHHSHNVGCFGSFTTFWDKIMGSDQAFLKHNEERLAVQSIKKEK
jgi:sterol desaturase/sphingolipid hydroxylase (fatty acid hydroxylase superfamily)